MDSLHLHLQVVHTCIRCHRNVSSFLISTIYASPNPMKRKSLWDYLGVLDAQINELWVIAGDFNAIIDGFERVGGANSTKNRCMHLREFMFNNSLHDLGFNGS